MNNTVSISLNKDFKRLYRRGKYIVSDLMVIYFMPNRSSYNRLGITVTKKLGKAVKRNRIRRLIRENYRLCEDALKPGYDIIFVARNKIVGRSFDDVSGAMNYLLRKSDIINRDSRSMSKNVIV